MNHMIPKPLSFLSKSISKVFIGLFLALCVGGCSRASREVHLVFDAALRGTEHMDYAVAGISRYQIQAYEIVQTSGSLVMVKVTYSTKSGRDLVETKKFELTAGGQLRSIEREDIETYIKGSLEDLATDAELYLLGKPKDTPISWDILVKNRPDLIPVYGPRSSVNGEDYTKAKFSRNADGALVLEVTDKDFNLVTYVSST
jgi:hypothetical protein